MAQVAALDPEWKLGAFTLAAIVIVVFRSRRRRRADARVPAVIAGG